MSDRRPFKHGVTVTLPTDPTDREAILNLWREQGIHVSGGQEGDGIANTDPEALLKPRRYRMNSLHDELVEALSIEDDDPTRMADRVLDVLQRETKSLGAAIAWEQGHLDVCTGCCCDFARINPYRAGDGAR